MSDEFTIDAKYKRDNLVAEHERYREALREVAVGAWENPQTAREIARRALAGQEGNGQDDG